MEIERKFLVEELPEGLEACQKRRIEQAYLSINPVVRVRRMDEAYVLTCKGSGLMMREEQEIPLSKAAYLRLLPKAEGTIIAKDRYCIPCGSYTIELDVFDEPLAPLVVAEVEFPTEDAAESFQPPVWFGREVTFDPAYTNIAFSRKSRSDTGIPFGRYRHFKGNEYEVLHVAANSETEELMVVYRAMYGEQDVWVRPASMWTETVIHNGKAVPRFSYIADTEAL